MGLVPTTVTMLLEAITGELNGRFRAQYMVGNVILLLVFSTACYFLFKADRDIALGEIDYPRTFVLSAALTTAGFGLLFLTGRQANASFICLTWLVVSSFMLRKKKVKTAS